MRGITLGVFSAQPTYDVDFQTNVLDVAQTMGYAIPPLEKRLLLNRLMKDMKDIGFFQIQDTLTNFALGITGFEQFRMIDWKKTGNVYTPYGGLIYTPEGIEGNGSDAYVGTNFNPATMGVNYTLLDANRGFLNYKIGAANNSSVPLDGVFNHETLNASYAWSRSVQRINTTGINNPPINLGGIGYKNLNRTSNTNINAYNSGSTEVSSSPSSSVVHSSEQVILNRGIGVGGNTFGVSGFGLYHMGASMTYPMSQSFRTIYNQFLFDSGLSPIA